MLKTFVIAVLYLFSYYFFYKKIVKGRGSMKKYYDIYAILFVCIFLLISTSYAILKYNVDGSSTLELAEWSVSLDQNGIDNKLTVVPGIADATYTLKVKNLSQVDVKYDVIVSNLPSGIGISIDNDNNDNFVYESNGIVTITNVGTILYNATNKTNVHTLYFKGGANADEYVNSQSVIINVIVKQIIGN